MAGGGGGTLMEKPNSRSGILMKKRFARRLPISQSFREIDNLGNHSVHKHVLVQLLD